MTNLHPAAVYILKTPGWKVRVWLALVITLALAGLPLPIAGLTLWMLAVPGLMTAETLARMVGEGQRVRRRLEAEHEGRISVLAERDARIVALEADLVRAQSAARVRPETAEQVVFRKVGLHPGAPVFLVLAARQAFRRALHPDRHPRHQRQAHDRYLAAEAVFEQIAKLRA